MSESTIAPGFGGPPPHTHQRLHDMFYVLESGFEHYMRDLGAAAKAGPRTPEVMGPIASRYDFCLLYTSDAADE